MRNIKIEKNSFCNTLKVFMFISLVIFLSLTFFESFSSTSFDLVAISLCVPIFLIAPSLTSSLPVTTSVSCLWVILSFSLFTHLLCSALHGFLSPPHWLVVYGFISPLIPPSLLLPHTSFYPYTLVFPLLCMHCICQVFLSAEALCSLCSSLLILKNPFGVPKLEAPFT